MKIYIWDESNRLLRQQRPWRWRTSACCSGVGVEDACVCSNGGRGGHVRVAAWRWRTPACGNGGHGGLVCGSGSDSNGGLLRVEVSSVRRRWRTSAGAAAAAAMAMEVSCVLQRRRRRGGGGRRCAATTAVQVSSRACGSDGGLLCVQVSCVRRWRTQM
jgi:hypothetical protein